MRIFTFLLVGCGQGTLDDQTDPVEITDMWWHLEKTEIDFFLEPVGSSKSGDVWMNFWNDPFEDLYKNHFGGTWKTEDGETFTVYDDYWTDREYKVHSNKEVETGCYKVSLNILMSDVACPKY